MPSERKKLEKKFSRGRMSKLASRGHLVKKLTRGTRGPLVRRMTGRARRIGHLATEQLS